MSRFHDFTSPISEKESEAEDLSLGALETGQPPRSEGTSVLYWFVFIAVMLVICGLGAAFKQRFPG